MQIEVYPSDADAVDAAAAMVAAHARAVDPGRRATVALGASRSGRAVMVALAARGDVPWTSVMWFLADERCAGPNDPLAHARVARDSLFVPRGVPAAQIHAPVVDAAGRGPAAA